VSWDSRFAEPIELPGGVSLASLREAIAHLVNTTPSSERALPVVLTAAELITSAAERGGPIEFARIATLRAVNRHAVRVFDTSCKNHHWGRRKLRAIEPWDHTRAEAKSAVSAGARPIFVKENVPAIRDAINAIRRKNRGEP
jgi:hypothetical protein